MSPQDIHIGLSALNNAYWTGIFYPEGLPASKRFAHCCAQFDTYEINSTFYKFPTVKSLKAWYDKSPEGFIFSVKAFKGITHYRRDKNQPHKIHFYLRQMCDIQIHSNAYSDGLR